MALFLTFRVIILSTFLLLTCSSCIYSVHGIDFESSKESPCFEIPKTVPVDMNFVFSTKTWYYPLMSRYDLYVTGVGLSEKSAEELQEDELYYDSCVELELSGSKFLSTSFGGKRHSFDVKSVKGSEIFKFSEPSGGGGTFHVTLTDNKTFVVLPVCWDTNQMAFGVASSVTPLPKETVKLIYDHVESLGFKREFFTGTRYDYCKSADY